MAQPTKGKAAAPASMRPCKLAIDPQGQPNCHQRIDTDDPRLVSEPFDQKEPHKGDNHRTAERAAEQQQKEKKSH